MCANLKSHPDGTSPENGEVFVFGSNEAGRHGKGAAKEALRSFGAIPGQALGYSGHAPKHSYAVPTKTKTLQQRHIGFIEQSILKFITFANSNPQLNFWMTRVGCGLAGYHDCQIVFLFLREDTPFERISWPEPWIPFIRAYLKKEIK